MTAALTKVEYDYTTVALVDGGFQYVITALVAEQGELPHTSLFVYQITDSVDASQDVFVRVATPYDLENVSLGREEALDTGNSYYLVSILMRKYADLNLAVQAKDAVKSRVNDGVRAWYDFKEMFTGTTNYYHPTTDATYEQQLQDSYYAARTSRVAAEVALVTAEETLATARAAADAQTAITETYKGQYSLIVEARAFWTNYFNAIKTTSGGQGFAGLTKAYQIPVASMLSHVSNTDPQYTSLVAAYEGQESNLSTFASSEINATGLTSKTGLLHDSLLDSYNSSLRLVTTKNTAVSTAVIAKKEAEATVASAQAAEDAALAAAIAVCPDFVPTI
jgi:hypothetical protein